MKQILVVVVIGIIVLVGLSFITTIDIFNEFGFDPVFDSISDINQDSTNKNTDNQSAESIFTGDRSVTTDKPEARKDVVTLSFRERFNNQPGLITLNSRLNSGEKLNITGWTIKSNSGSFIIPSAVNNYRIGEANNEESIILERSHVVYIYLDRDSPLPNDYNIRLNQCTGFLNERYQLERVLPKDCPLPSKSEYQHFSGECQNFIDDIGKCETPAISALNSLRTSDANKCRAFVVDNYNIGECYDRSNKEVDFLDTEWRVWIDKYVFDDDHDWIRLINSEGIVIDDYTY